MVTGIEMKRLGAPDSKGADGLSITPEARTNSIVLVGTEDDLRLAKIVLEGIDVPVKK